MGGSRDDLDSPSPVPNHTSEKQAAPPSSSSRYANYASNSSKPPRGRDRNGGSQAQDLLARLQDKPSGTML